jgi:hypothetical protein
MRYSGIPCSYVTAWLPVPGGRTTLVGATDHWQGRLAITKGNDAAMIERSAANEGS